MLGASPTSAQVTHPAGTLNSGDAFCACSAMESTLCATGTIRPGVFVYCPGPRRKAAHHLRNRMRSARPFAGHADAKEHS